MTVFAVQPTDDDVTAAAQWGEIRYVNHRYINGDEIRATGGLPIEFQENLRAAADDFKPETDYLLIIGDHLQIVAFAAMLAHRYSRLRVLRWDRREKAYFPVTVDAT